MDESTDALAKFSARCDSVKLLFAMVSSIHNMKKDQYAVLRLHAKGLRISIESTAKCMHATAYMNREHFSAFELPPVRGEGTEIQCKIHMTTLLECLSIFGTNALASTALYLAYSEEEGILHLLLEHAGITSECDLSTVAVDTMQDYEAAFRAYPTVAKAVMMSEVLHDSLRELCDQQGANTLFFSMSPEEPYMRLHTFGGLGSCTVDVAKSSDAFLTFEADAAHAFTYNLRLIESGLRAVAAAKQTFLRLNAAGMLSFAHKLETEDGSNTIISYTIMPEEGGGEEGAATQEETSQAAASHSGHYDVDGYDALPPQHPRMQRVDDASGSTEYAAPRMRHDHGDEDESTDSHPPVTTRRMLRSSLLLTQETDDSSVP